MQSGMVGAAPSIAQQVQDQTERDCETWQDLITAQDDFVAALLQHRAELQHRLAEAQQQSSVVKEQSASARAEQERLVGISQLEAQVAQARETYQEHLKAQEEAEKTLTNLDAQLAQLNLQSTQPVESPKAGVRAKADRSPPLVLVLINGTVAPFSDALIQKGTAGGREASSLLRGQIELDISSLSTEGEVKVLCFLYYDRLQVIPSLERSRVISNPSTWRHFVDGFSRVTGNFIIDVANSAPAEEHMAAVLSKVGFMSNVQQVYLAGVHPEHGVSDVVEQQPDATAQLGEAFLDQVMPKINLVRHLPLPAMGELTDSTTELAGVFESSIALPLDATSRTPASLPTSRSAYPAASSSSRPAPATTYGGSTPSVVAPSTGQKRPVINPGEPVEPECFWTYLAPQGCNARHCDRSHDYRLTPAEQRRLRDTVKKLYPCSELRKTGKCTYAAKHGGPCMFAHDVKVMPRFD
ncbi:hypothetical protein JCM3775_002346 [Rhodotorula graminis]